MAEIGYSLERVRVDERLSPGWLVAAAAVLLAMMGLTLVFAVHLGLSDLGLGFGFPLLGILLMVRTMLTTTVRWSVSVDSRYLVIDRTWLHRDEREQIPVDAILGVWREEDQRRVRVAVPGRHLSLGTRSTPEQRAELFRALSEVARRPASVGDQRDVPATLHRLREEA